jgi:dipeptidase E
MKQLFLTSTVSVVARDIATKINTKGKKLVFIDTAAEVKEGDKSWLENDRQALLDIGYQITNYTISDKSSEQLMSDLKKFDAIYMCGGNSLYLLQQSQLSGFIEIIRELVLKQGKTYIGTSAGSVVAGPDMYPVYRLEKAVMAPKLKGYKSYSLVNFCILPHWGSDHFRELYLNRRLEHAYLPNQVPLIVLTDNQYVWVRDDQMEIIVVNSQF